MLGSYLKLYAGTQNQVSQISRVLSSRDFNNRMIWIVLPDTATEYTVSHFHQFPDGCELSHALFREGHVLRISFNDIDKSIGLHQYEIGLKHPITDDDAYLYIQYIIQDDNPDTPYIYMNRKETENVTGDIFEQDVLGEQETE